MRKAVMAHSNMLHGGTRGPESTGHSLQSPEVAKEPEDDLCQPIEIKPRQTKIQTAKKQECHRNQKENSEQAKPQNFSHQKTPNLWFFFLHTRKMKVNQIKVVRRGSKCTWLEIHLRNRRLQDKKPRKNFRTFATEYKKVQFYLVF